MCGWMLLKARFLNVEEGTNKCGMKKSKKEPWEDVLKLEASV
jgi:hypothetical protein